MKRFKYLILEKKLAIILNILWFQFLVTRQESTDQSTESGSTGERKWILPKQPQ